MRVVVLLAVLTVGPALAGCINPGDETAADLGVPTAWMAHDAAVDAFHLNGTEPVFYGMVGIESIAAGAYLADRVPTNMSALAADDHTIADGRTPTWFGFWRSAEGDVALSVEGVRGTSIMAPDGNAVYPFGRGFLNEMASRVPIGKGWIDSERALAVAMRTNGELADMVERFDVDIVMVLQRLPDANRPVWTIVASPVQSEERQYAVIDAIDGREEKRYFERALWVDDHTDADAYGHPAVVKFHLESEAGVLFLEFERNGNRAYGGSNHLLVEIEHPDGRIDIAEAARWPQPSAVFFTGAAAGEYQVTATPIMRTGSGDLLGMDRVHVHWCAAGVVPDPTTESQRGDCDRNYDYL